MIRACPSPPGAALTLHVATDSARCRVAFYRRADGPQAVRHCAWLPGTNAAESAPDQGWDWPACAFAFPADWPTSADIGKREEAGRRRCFGRARAAGAALFVMRAPRPHARMGGSPHKLPRATWHAYNCSGGGHAADFGTDLDIHADPALLQDYRLLCA